MADVDGTTEGQGSTDNSGDESDTVSRVMRLANLANLHYPETAERALTNAMAEQIQKQEDQIQGLEAELHERAFGRIKALETEIAFQRKVNSSWQTPIPPRPKQDP